MTILLKNGQRGLLVGQTGSGKTSNAVWQLRNCCSFPCIIFDTKFDDQFFQVPENDEEIELVESFEEFVVISKRAKNKMPEYILVRPSDDEIMNLELLDFYAQLCYDKFGKCFIYIDELYSWHTPGGTPTKGLVALYTRGRSRGKTLLASTQRPARISRFCMSESQKFYAHWLGDQRDYKILSEVIPGIDKSTPPPKYHFYHFEAGEHTAPLLFSPVPFQKINPEKIFTKKWI